MNLKKKLIKAYKDAFSKSRKKEDCIKYFYEFNHVKVHLYFDAYYEYECNLYMILIYHTHTYYIKFDIEQINHNKLFLKNLGESSKEIFFKILKNKSLQDFYERTYFKISF